MLKRILALLCMSLLLLSLFTVPVFAERRTSLPVTLKSTVPEKVVIKRFELESVTKKGEEKELVFNVGYIKDKSWQFGIYLDAYDAEGCTVGRYTLGLKGDVGYNEGTWTLKTTDPIATFEISAQKATSDSSSYYYREYMTVYSADGREMDISVLQEPDYKEVGWSESVVLYSYNDGKFTAGISVKPYEIEEYQKQGWYTEEETKSAVTMYAADSAGNFTRTLIVPQRLVEAYRAVGWHTEEEKTLLYRKTQLPVILKNKSGAETRIDSFEITSVEAISAYNIEVKFKIKGNKFNGKYWDSIHAICYDVNGNYIETRDMTYLYDDEERTDDVMLPINTASIELVANDPVEDSQSYLYCKYVNVYAPDGRVMGVTDLQVPTYELVGWYREVTLYALSENGTKSVVIPAYKQADYEKVGWYTAENLERKIILDKFAEYRKNRQYNEVFVYFNKIYFSYYNTDFGKTLLEVRTAAMDEWRNYCGRPMGLMEYSLSKNNAGTPEVTISFRNISYKNIIAFKVKFDCYNVFGEREIPYANYFYTDKTNFGSTEYNRYTWTLYGTDSVHTVKNIRVTEVVFADGTKWYGK